jgi:hypothetical protein
MDQTEVAVGKLQLATIIGNGGFTALIGAFFPEFGTTGIVYTLCVSCQ